MAKNFMKGAGMWIVMIAIVAALVYFGNGGTGDTEAVVATGGNCRVMSGHVVLGSGDLMKTYPLTSCSSQTQLIKFACSGNNVVTITSNCPSGTNCVAGFNGAVCTKTQDSCMTACAKTCSIYPTTTIPYPATTLPYPTTTIPGGYS